MDILVNDMKILIVDDSAMIRERLIRMLSSLMV
jgi:PleD family two-component response regulator